jgi:hypothetical protein
LKLLPLPLETIFADMWRSIEAKLYYPALIVALTIPDICVGLTMPKAEHVKKPHYNKFIADYGNRELPLEECYMLRGGVVHRADLRGHAHIQTSHVIFTTPESQIKIHSLTMQALGKSAMVFDLQSFCQAMEAAARRWYEANAKNSVVEENLKNIIRICPNGLSPFVVGQPILASGE